MFKKVILAGAAVVFTCALTELALDLFFTGVVFYRPHELYIRRWPPMQLIERYAPNARYHHAIYGDLAAMSGQPRFRRMRDVRFTTDAWGFCNPDFDASRPADTVIIGDSFGLGADTSEEAAWPQRLAARGRSVYNLSMSGSSLWHSYINALTQIDRVKTTSNAVLLVCAFGGNDLDEPYFPIFDKSALPWQSLAGRVVRELKSFVAHRRLVILARKAMHSSQLSVRPEAEKEFVVTRELGDGRTMLFYSAYTAASRRSTSNITQHVNFPLFTNTLHAIGRLADEQHLRLVVISFPSKEEVYDWILDGRAGDKVSRSSAFTTVLADLCQTEGIEFLDLTPGLKAAALKEFASGKELLWWEDDTHMNDRGNAVISELVWNRLAGQ